MANSIEDALNRASPEAKAKAQEAMTQFTKTASLSENQTKTAGNPQTPSTASPKPEGLDKAKPNEVVQPRIDAVEKSKGNNHENAMDRAKARPAAEPPKQEPPTQGKKH